MRETQLDGISAGALRRREIRRGKLYAEPGDILVFYSDGFSEGASPDGQFFGSERLCDAIAANHELSADGLADLLLAEVEKFTANAPLSDDRTLVVLKVKPDNTKVTEINDPRDRPRSFTLRTSFAAAEAFSAKAFRSSKSREKLAHPHIFTAAPRLRGLTSGWIARLPKRLARRRTRFAMP